MDTSASWRKACRVVTSQEPDAVDTDSVLVDVNVQSITEPGSLHKGQITDIPQFSSAPYDHKGANGKVANAKSN
jgi:hypothetical protein